MNKKVILYVAVLLAMIACAVAQSTTNKTSSSTSNILVTYLSQDPDPVEPGKYVDLRWKIENFGADLQQDVTFELLDRYPFSVDDPRERVKTVKTLGARQTGDAAVVLKWRVRVAEDVVEGTNEIELRYNTKSGSSIKMDPFLINIKSSETILSIESVKFNPERIAPGSTTTLTLGIENLATVLLKDIHVVLDLTDSSFSPIGSTSEKILRQLKSGEKSIVEFTLAADASAVPKVHKLPLTINYTSSGGQSRAVSSSLGAIVDSPAEYVLNLEDTSVYVPDSKGTIVVSLSNIAAGDLKFVTLSLLSDSQYTILSPATVYLGTLESDDFETAEYEIYIKPGVEQSIALALDVSYKDSYNNAYKDHQTLTIPIYSSGEAQNYGLVEKTSSWWVWILVVVILIVSWWAWRRHTKKA